MDGLDRGLIPWGDEHHSAFESYFGKTVNLGVCCEDLPEPCNTVTLDPQLTDSHGIAALKITYRLSDNTERMLRHGLARGEEDAAAGAQEVYSEGPLKMAGWHMLGTARMGFDPETSVVNSGEKSRCASIHRRWQRFRDLWWRQPNRDHQATALHIADRMKRNLANLFD